MQTRPFGPRNNKEVIIFAQEQLRVETQQLLFETMNRKNITEAQLAKLLGVSKKVVNRYFKSNWNPRIRKVARIFAALDMELDIKEYVK